MNLYEWHMIPSITASAINEKQLLEVSVSGKRVGLLKIGKQIFAFAATCPHAGASLCEGWLDAQNRIVCPLHKYRYDPANGRNTSGEGYKLKTYPLEIREDAIYIGLQL